MLNKTMPFLGFAYTLGVFAARCCLSRAEIEAVFMERAGGGDWTAEYRRVDGFVHKIAFGIKLENVFHKSQVNLLFIYKLMTTLGPY